MLVFAIDSRLSTDLLGSIHYHTQKVFAPHIDHAVILLLLTPTPPFLLTHAWWHRHGGGPGSIQILRMAKSTHACVSKRW